MAESEKLALVEAIDSQVESLTEAHLSRRSDWYFHDIVPVGEGGELPREALGRIPVHHLRGCTDVAGPEPAHRGQPALLPRPHREAHAQHVCLRQVESAVDG